MNGQDRRAWLDGIDAQINEALRYYLGPTGLAPKVNALAAGAGMVMDGTDFVDAYGASGNMMRNPSAMNALAMVPPVMALAMPGISNRLLQGAGEMAGDAARFVTAEDGGVKLFHGSPHDFDKFSMDKIGTGEGAQAYGHGLYFAGDEAVAKSYRDQLRFPRIDGASTPVEKVADDLNYHRGNVEGVRKIYEGMLANGDEAAKKMAQEKLAALPEAVDRFKGRMYEVNVNANPEDFLDWDMPLAGQSPNVRAAVRSVAPRAGGMDSGQRLLDAIAPNNATPFTSAADRARAAASAKLKDAGIPGIRYLDAGSRGAGDGSRNYVVFDENLINIVRKYGIAGAAGLLGATVADVEQAMAGGNSQGNALRDYVVGRDGPAMPPRADR
jgi:hypothetical protein